MRISNLSSDVCSSDLLCGAPIVMQLLLGATAEEKRHFNHQVRFMTAAAPPPAAVLAAMQDAGIEVTHVYGLTAVYGPVVVRSDARRVGSEWVSTCRSR